MPLIFPNIDPIAVSFDVAQFHFQIHWYALAYLAGFIGAWALAVRLTKLYPAGTRPQGTDIDDFLTWAILGVLLGGRIGYVLFYNFSQYWDEPLEALKIWHGGMSFHGGALGVILMLILFAYFKKVSLLRLADIVTVTVPIGLFLGRLANFVNGELYGRVTDAPIGMIFPHGGNEPRHPSQLYEAAGEGVVLFFILLALILTPKIRQRPGIVCGTFLLGYGVIRGLIEFFREPDIQLGFLFGGVTMGQILCVPMIAVGFVLIMKSLRAENGPITPASADH